MIMIRQKAPEFCIPNQDEVEICLRDLLGRWIVLYFYPKDNTTECVIQACDFTQQEVCFDDMDAIILGVSPNSCKENRKFIEKANVGFTLLSDGNKIVCKAYDICQEKQISRSTFLINPKGEIEYIWNNVKVRYQKTINGEKIKILHVDEVKNKLLELQNG